MSTEEGICTHPTMLLYCIQKNSTWVLSLNPPSNSAQPNTPKNACNATQLSPRSKSPAPSHGAGNATSTAYTEVLTPQSLAGTSPCRPGCCLSRCGGLLSLRLCFLLHLLHLLLYPSLWTKTPSARAPTYPSPLRLASTMPPRPFRAYPPAERVWT
jgi:hypothetical protein